ncbi:MAG TPA: hypothetical protein VIS07_08385 [Candidatus Binatia bacterium]
MSFGVGGVLFVGLVLGSLGALITVVPIALVGVVARAWYGLGHPELCGLLAGSMTDPPALAFAQQSTESDVPAVAYATVYPLTLLRVFSVQVLIFVLH